MSGSALIVQLLLQGQEAEAEAMSRFFASLALPTSLEQLGASLSQVLGLSSDQLERAVKRADELGQLFLRSSDRR